MYLLFLYAYAISVPYSITIIKHYNFQYSNSEIRVYALIALVLINYFNRYSETFNSPFRKK